jgi:cyanate permease
MNGIGQIGEALGALFAGVLYKTAPLLPFLLQIGVWILALVLTRSLVEPGRTIPAPASHIAEAWRTARFAFLENGRLRSIILLNAVLGLASFYPVWLIQPYMQHAGVPITWFGPVWTGANLTVAFFAIASHRVAARMGSRNMVILFMALIAVGYLGLGLTGQVGGFLFYYLLTGMRGLRGPMLMSLSQQESPSANRASILSLQSLCFRLLFCCTGPFVGVLADSVGVRQTFYLLFYVFLIALPPLFILFLRNHPGRTIT